MTTMLKTIFGTAKTDSEGYYIITSRKEGNHTQFLHRLIWEKVWGKLPKGWVVHHIDGDKTNNCILNLYGMPETQHLSLHNKGKNNHFYGKKHSEESLNKMRKNYARIIKIGYTSTNKQRYAIKSDDGVKLKSSTKLHQLINWFTEMYPNHILNLNIHN